MAGQHQDDVVVRQRRQGGGRAARDRGLGLGLRRQQRMMRDDHTHNAARHGVQARNEPQQPCPGDPAARPVPIQPEPARGVEPQHRHNTVAPTRLGLGPDHRPPARIGIGEPLEQIIGRDVVIARHRKLWRVEPLQKCPRGPEFRMPPPCVRSPLIATK